MPKRKALVPSVITPQKRRPPAAVLWEQRKVFPHEREDSGGFEQLDLLVLRGDEFGCLAPLSDVFTESVFVQPVWVAVDLDKKSC